LNPQSNLNITDSDLIKGCLENDRRMQQELYNRFAPKMYGVCLRYTGNGDDAQDVLQDGFVKVFRKLDSFRSEGSFEGWIRRVFVNTAIEHFRRKHYMQPVTEREENTLESKTLTALDGLSEKDILKLVQELAPGYRAVFNLYVVEGYAHKEIAEMLGITEGTSKSQLSRAKVILQDMIKQHTGIIR
jgi:RNA polymerase sigma factor (sigma-70 family)